MSERVTTIQMGPRERPVDVIHVGVSGTPGTNFTAAEAADINSRLAAAEDVLDAIDAESLVDDIARLRGLVVNVRAHGATGDGTTDDLAAIHAAIAAAGEGAVWFPAGIYRVSNKVNVPNRVRLLGGGGETTVIRAHPSFPANTPVIHLGPGVQYAHECLVEGLTIDGNSVPGSTGVYSTSVQERGGVRDCLVIKFQRKGIHFGGDAANYMLHDLEVFGHPVDANCIAIDLEGNPWKNSVKNLTIDKGWGDVGAKMLCGIRANGQLHASNIHIEDCNNGIQLLGPYTHAYLHSITGLEVDNLIHSVATNEGHWMVFSIMRSGGSILIKNDKTGDLLGDIGLASYVQQGGAAARTQSSAPGVTSTFDRLQIGQEGTAIARVRSVTHNSTGTTVPANGLAEFYPSVPGAAVGDAVMIGPPATLPNTVGVQTARVQSAGSVAVLVRNYSASPVALSYTWRVTVVSH